jgi:hypothetical protein
MPKRKPKEDPTYLDQLGSREGLSIADQLWRENQKEFVLGRQLTAEEYHQLLQWTSDRLIETRELPPKLSADRSQAFENAFYLAFRHKGLL